MNVLILTGKFGLGHYTVANALAEEIKRTIDGNVYIKDVFVCSLGEKSKLLYSTFSFVVKRGSRLYNLVYRRTESSNRSSPLLCKSHFIHNLEQLINETKADVVISTFTFCSKIAALYKREVGSKIPLITCITDFTSHIEWLYPETDLYLVAAPEIRNYLLNKGVLERQILTYGIPVCEQFKSGTRSNNHKEKQLLIMGGGLGMLPKSKSFYKRLDKLQDIKTTVITGNNKMLYHSLKNKCSNTIVLGCVNDVYRYMFEADLMLSKPGGVTTFEAICAELPLLIYRPFLEQEIQNGAFIKNHRMGIELSKKPREAILEIQSILQNKELLEELRSNMQRFKSSFAEEFLPDFLLRFEETP